MDQMVKTISLDALYDVRYKNVHGVHPQGAPKPQGTVLLEVLKTLEHQITARHLLPSNHKTQSFHPLWFQAETERNVFLWRAGFSIIEKDDFEFWINVPQLINKRLSFLKKGPTDSPFLHPKWSFSDDVSSSIDAEIKYLNELYELFDSVAEHATALCEVSSLVLAEISPVNEQKTTVVLPVIMSKRRNLSK